MCCSQLRTCPTAVISTGKDLSKTPMATRQKLVRNLHLESEPGSLTMTAVFVLRVNLELLVQDIIQKNRGTLQCTWSTHSWGLGVAMGSISTTDNKFLPSSIAQLFLPEQLTTSEQVFWCIIRDKQITRKLLVLSSQ